MPNPKPVGGPNDHWHVLPFLREFDAFGMGGTDPSSHSLVLTRGEMCMVVEFSTRAWVRGLQGDWSDTLRMAGWLIEQFDNFELYGPEEEG